MGQNASCLMFEGEKKGGNIEKKTQDFKKGREKKIVSL